MAVRVTPLSRMHKLNNFDCGNIELNTYLRETARQHQRKNISKTYVLAHEHAPADVIGFYTLALRKMVPVRAFPAGWGKGLPSEVPAISLARLAVHHTEKNKGYGAFLLFDAMHARRLPRNAWAATRSSSTPKTHRQQRSTANTATFRFPKIP